MPKKNTPKFYMGAVILYKKRKNSKGKKYVIFRIEYPNDTYDSRIYSIVRYYGGLLRPPFAMVRRITDADYFKVLEPDADYLNDPSNW
jgi:hypothetical protein